MAGGNQEGGGLLLQVLGDPFGGRGLQGGGGLEEEGGDRGEGGEEAHRAGPRGAGEGLESGALEEIAEGYQDGSGGRT